MPKQTIIKLRNNFKGKQNSTKRKTTTYHKVDKIGILIQAKELKNSSAINTFVNRLKSEGKKVSVLCFSENESTLYFDFDFDQFTLKDISWGGNITKSSVNLFTAQTFDYLMCLTIHATPAIERILIESNAFCRAGLQHNNNESLLDLMIYSNNENITPAIIGEEILDLVQKIKTND